ncbi:cation-transporting P-type ATPase, partial [Clostridium sp.]|uniref:P-type ATPase n=1 Tax=Clostridium sp. TaxID=1506 RepID=UPI0034645E81
MEKWYGRAVVHILEELKVIPEKGIEERELYKRTNEYGSNSISLKERESIFKLLYREIINPFIIYIIVSLFIGYYFKSYIILGIHMMFFIGYFYMFIKGYKKDHEFIEEFENLNNIDVKVMRGYSTKIIKSSDLVVGDLVYLSEGDVVPGDIRLIECKNLKINEYLISGEKEPVEKYPTKIEEKDLSINLIGNMVFMGSKVIKGQGSGVVVEVGDKTQIGKVIGFTDINSKGDMEFKNEAFNYLNRIIYYITALSIGFGIISFIYYKDIKLSLNLFLKTFQGSYPIWLFVIITMISIKEVKEFKKKGIHINSFDTLIRATSIHSIFMNKEGALSDEVLTLRRIYTDSKYIKLYDIDEFKEINGERMLSIAYLTSSVKGNSSDKAIMNFIESNGLSEITEEFRTIKAFEIPYDSGRRLKTVVNRIENFYRAHVKGDVDVMLEASTHIMKEGVEIELTREYIDGIKNAHIEMSNNGLRVIALAYRNFAYEPSSKENIESHLVFVGLIGLKSEFNTTSVEDVAYCIDNAIVPTIATDEDKLSCLHTLKYLNINGGLEKIQSGIEIDYTTHEEFERNVYKYRIFSRINSYHKYIILRELRDRGMDILLFLDNMTYLPMMSLCSLGVGVGKNLTNMIKKLCPIYIEENYLHNMIFVIKRGKSIYKGGELLEKFLKFTSIVSTLSIFLWIAFIGGSNESIYIWLNLISIIIALKLFYSESKTINVVANIMIIINIIICILLYYLLGWGLIKS